jgi:hypothetical protein
MLTRVQQFHQTQEHIKKLEPLLQASNGTMQISKWNGAAEFLAERAEDFVEFMKCVYGADQLGGMFHDFLFYSSWSFLSLSCDSGIQADEHCVSNRMWHEICGFGRRVRDYGWV